MRKSHDDIDLIIEVLKAKVSINFPDAFCWTKSITEDKNGSFEVELRHELRNRSIKVGYYEDEADEYYYTEIKEII